MARPGYRALISNAIERAQALLNPWGGTHVEQTREVATFAEFTKKVGEAAGMLATLQAQHNDKLGPQVASVRDGVEGEQGLRGALAAVLEESQPTDLVSTSMKNAIGFTAAVGASADVLVERQATISALLNEGMAHLEGFTTGIINPLNELIPPAPEETLKAIGQTNGVVTNLVDYRRPV